MIKNFETLKKFEDCFRKEEGKLPFEESLKIFESMWMEGIKLGVLPPKEELEGIEVDIQVAKVLNSCSKKSWRE